MQKIILDTNVVVSALIGSSHPREILYSLVFNKKVVVCLSAEIFSEYVNVLNRSRFIKYPGFVTNAEIVLNKLDDLSQKHFPVERIEEIRDVADNKFLELGVAARADFLITGNSNDFTFKEFRGFKIVNPEEYINTYFKV